MEAQSDKLVEDLRAVVTAAEELLNATAAEGGQRLEEARARTEESLRAARARLEGASHDLQEQVRQHPLAAVGIAAAIGFVVGLLVARR
jgi:ElaB/YqjD/DUF883 family membrane-anchored ribosome-binding protein